MKVSLEAPAVIVELIRDCSNCERVLTFTTNNGCVGDTSTKIEGVVGSTTNQCRSGDCTGTSKQSNASAKVGVVAGVDAINQQGVSTGSTVNSGAGDKPRVMLSAPPAVSVAEASPKMLTLAALEP